MKSTFSSSDPDDLKPIVEALFKATREDLHEAEKAFLLGDMEKMRSLLLSVIERSKILKKGQLE